MKFNIDFTFTYQWPNSVLVLYILSNIVEVKYDAKMVRKNEIQEDLQSES